MRPGDVNYESLRLVFNAMVDRHPGLIARCTGPADVRAAVDFARDTNRVVAVRGGGHSAAGKGTCDDGVLIDLSPMQAVHVDRHARVAIAQGGNTWGTFDRETAEHGLATTGGVDATTGIGGLTLGGGWGWLTRRLGLACDNVLAFDLVTADGQQIRCSELEHEDVYWALRGGGGNFGAVTSFTYQLHTVDEVIGCVYSWRVEDAARVMRWFDESGPELPESLGGGIVLTQLPKLPGIDPRLQGVPTLSWFGCWSGERSEGERTLRRIRDIAPTIFERTVAHRYVHQQQSLYPGTGLTGEVPVVYKLDDRGYQRRRTYWKAGYLDRLTDDVIEKSVAHAADRCSPTSIIEFILLGGGAVGRLSENETAFSPRSVRWAFNINANWEASEDDQTNIDWARSFHRSLAPHALRGVYLNYLGLDADESADRVREAWSPSKYERLSTIKAAVDPANLFSANLNIAPASDAAA